MRDIKIVESTSKAYDHLLKVGNRPNGTLGSMSLGFTYEEIYKIFKEAQKAVATRDPDASIDINEQFNEAIEELNEARDTIEAVKKWYTVHEFFPVKTKDLDELKKILEAEA